MWRTSLAAYPAHRRLGGAIHANLGAGILDAHTDGVPGARESAQDARRPDDLEPSVEGRLHFGPVA